MISLKSFVIVKVKNKIKKKECHFTNCSFSFSNLRVDFQVNNRSEFIHMSLEKNWAVNVGKLQEKDLWWSVL